MRSKMVKIFLKLNVQILNFDTWSFCGRYIFTMHVFAHNFFSVYFWMYVLMILSISIKFAFHWHAI